MEEMMDQKTSRRGFFGMLAGVAAAVAGLWARPAKASVWDNPTTWRGLPVKVVDELPRSRETTLTYRGITLTMVQTKLIEQSFVNDKSWGGTRVRLSVSAVIKMPPDYATPQHLQNALAESGHPVTYSFRGSAPLCGDADSLSVNVASIEHSSFVRVNWDGAFVERRAHDR
jgi:hypothetical protein